MTIREIAADWTGTAQELADHLNAATIEVKDETFYTSRQLVNVIGPDAYRIVAGTIAVASQSDPLLSDLATTLRTTGISFADPLTQVMIDQLSVAGSWPDGIAEAMKGIGIQYVSIADQEIGDVCTLEFAQDLLDSAYREKTLAVLASAFNEYLEPAKSSQASPVTHRQSITAALQMAIAHLEAM